jgi:glycosyltransferase involved in cell wall biosynthesis
MKRLAIDINAALSFYTLGKHSGIGRTTRELVLALNRQYDSLDFEIVLYSQNTKRATGKLLKTQFKSKHLNYPNRSAYKKLFNLFPIKEWLAKHDLIHIPHNADIVFSNSKTLITLHDAMFFSYPEEFLNHENARKTVPPLAKACKGIVTCSEASKQDIMQYMNIPAEKITVIPWGVDRTTFFLMEDRKVKQTLSSLGICSPFFLMVSCDIGRKNTINVIRAFKALGYFKKNYTLVLVWKNPPQSILDEFKVLIDQKSLIILETVTDEQLNALYNGAQCSFFPSKYEGFGLPVLESFECGTPVVTCNNSSLKEVGVEAAIYVNPDQAEEMTEIMRDFIEKRVTKAQYFEKVRKQAANYCWDKTAQSYIDFYKKHLLD